jgi:sugar lactone lactonase YvrE
MLRTLALALITTSVTGTAITPPRPIPALAPVEILAEGFARLRGIAVDADDAVFVSDRESGTVTRLSSESRRVVARRLERPVGLAFDHDGRMLVAEERAGRVVRLDPEGPTPLAHGIKQPRWLAVSEDGTVYISARRLTRDVDPEPDDETLEPEVILTLTPDGVLSVFADGFDHLQGLVVHGDAVYAATTGPRGVPRQGGVVYRIPILPGGHAGKIARLGPRDVFERPVGLAVDRVGALYASAASTILDGPRSNRAIVKIRPDGGASTFATGLEDPRGLALDSLGHLYVADGNAGRVLRFLAPPPPSMGAVAPFTRLAAVTLSGSTSPHARVDVASADGGVPISTTAAATGAFQLSITPRPNTPNRAEVMATGMRGRGLASPPSEVAFVHDTIAPALVLVTPPAGGFVRGTVEVRADAADTGSQIATLSLGLAGATVTPALPALAASAVATWRTAESVDGAHTLTATATDRAGNVASVSRVAIVDNTPPETERRGGPTEPITQTTATFSFNGTDNLTLSASLQFAWRLDGGAFGAFVPDTSLTLSGLTPGPHVVEVVARDLAGNVDPTPARWEFSVLGTPGVTVTITSPASGASVPSEGVIVRGTVQTAGAEASISVNGFAALVHGADWAVQLPMAPGVAVITAIARTASGAEGRASITVAPGGSAPVVTLRAEPASGVAPLAVGWRLTSRASRPLVRFELDENGTGAFGAAMTTLDGVQSLYTSPGLRLPTVRATDDLGAVHVVTTLVQVDDATTATARFQTLWGGFKARLQAGDQTGALAHLAPALRSRFEPILKVLGPALPAIAAGFGPIELIDQVEDLAETAILQTEDGVTRLYFVYFRRDNRGQWLIQEM